VSYLDKFSAVEICFLIVSFREAGIGVGESYQGSMVQKYLDATPGAHRPGPFWATRYKLASLSADDWAQLRWDMLPITFPAHYRSEARAEDD
jgi:hypothetical protein